MKNSDFDYMHLAVVDVCSEIGSVARCNNHYTAGLTRRIIEAGIDISQMSVGELIRLSREHSEFYNRIHGGAA